jgi:Ca2+-binding RTX toxin-like protein
MLRLLARVFGPRPTTDRQGRRTKRARLPLTVEALEGRCVPATLQVVNGVLTYTAGAGVVNNLTIAQNVVGYILRDTAETINVLGVLDAAGSGTHTVLLYAGAVPPAGMNINLGDGADRLLIDETYDAISVKAGDGSDLIDVGQFGGGDLSAIQAPVTVDGEGGIDTLRVNDLAGTVGRSYVVTAAKVTEAGGLDVSYVGTDNLIVNAGAAPLTSFFSDLFSIRSTAADTRTTLNGSGATAFTVGHVVNTLDDIKGPLILNGGAETAPLNQLVLLDQNAIAGHSYTLRADNAVARSGGTLIAYRNVGALWLFTSNFADTVAVLGTPADTVASLNLGGGNDRVTLGNANSLDGFSSTLVVNGGSETDTIILNDQGEADANRYIVTATDVTRDGLGLLYYENAEGLTLNAGAADDLVRVASTTAAAPVTLKTGGGNDRVEVGSLDFPPQLGTILGGVTVDGQGGSDYLGLFDYGSSPLTLSGDGTALVPVDYTVTATSVSRTQAAPVAYAGVEYLDVTVASTSPIFFNTFTADGNDVFVKSTSAATRLFIGAAGSYTVTVGSDAGSLDPIRGSLDVYHQGALAALVLNDLGDANANSYTITDTGVARSGAAGISYQWSGAEPTLYTTTLSLYAGAFGDSVLVTSTSDAVRVTLDMGGGSDTVTIGGTAAAGAPTPLLAIASPVVIHGGAGADAIVVNDLDPGTAPVFGGAYTITASNLSRSVRKILVYDATAERLTLNAGSGGDLVNVESTRAETAVVVRSGPGDDTFKVSSSAVQAGVVTFDGQGGTDTLDYSADTAGVRVNLALGTATGIAGGVSNIENVTGGQGDDILVGDDLANVLRGGAGRDILIGRGGADQLFGEAGDDLLIGGSTAHDLVPARLEDLMREWGRTGLTGPPQVKYATRVNDLLGITPGGLNGTTTLNLSQVSDDGAADTLDGGSELDWFFALGADSVLAPEPTERVN